jgi:type I restriction enzyme S subunit
VSSWEARTIGSIGDVKMCKRILKEQTNPIGDIPFFKIGTFGKKPDAYIESQLFETYKKKYSYPKIGDILISAAGTIGRKVCFDGFPSYYQDSNIVWLSHDETIILNTFLFYVYDNITWQTENTTISRLYNNIILEKIIVIPSLPEQQKIASFLSTVDEKINLLKKQLTLLEQYKKGMTQKIFSREIRFKDEEGNEFPEWEEKKIMEIMDERNSQAPKSLNYPLMAFIAKKGVTPKGDRYNREFLVNDQENKKYKKTEYGDFIYSSNNLETGSIGLNKYGSATISPVYSIFKINELADFRFLSDYLSRKEFIYKMTTYRQGVVYGQWRIHESDFLQIKEFIPSVSEQKKIASFLSAIDEKIDKNENQIRKMELWKKGLLQQMFI